MKNIKILSTLGPSSLDKKVIRRLTELGVDMFRLNLSHITIDQLESNINIIRDYSNVPICLDTEGAQVRTGVVKGGKIFVKEGEIIELISYELSDNKNLFYFTPLHIMDRLSLGDLISIDYDSCLIQVIDKTSSGIKVMVLSEGEIHSNKAVSILQKNPELEPLTAKDLEAIMIGKKLKINNVALSFANSGKDVKLLRELCSKDCSIISKIETTKAIDNLNEIIRLSDAILIDRGDLSKEELIEEIPFLQKFIINKANEMNKEVYVATNLLESMIRHKSPTRAEVNDVINTLIDGADGLVLAAETAIGDYPIESVGYIKNLISTYNMKMHNEGNVYNNIESTFINFPHGGKLIQQIKIRDKLEYEHELLVDEQTLLDVEQIANGGYSPLTGFMDEKNLKSVLNEYYLTSGEVWTMPVILQVCKGQINNFVMGDRIALLSKYDNKIYGILELSDVYKINSKEISLKLFNTNDAKHPGVNNLKNKGNYCLGGTIESVRKLKNPYKRFIFTPEETRFIFDKRGWKKIIGFHTRNVIHKAHEYIQIKALSESFADGLFIHPLIGPKKKLDFSSNIILKSYQMMIDNYYPKGKILLGGFPSYPRYAAAREAVFTAICRQNYGCSHFIIGRDHSGVGKYSKSTEAKDLFEFLKSGLNIEPIYFDKVSYCKKCKDYVEDCNHTKHDFKSISASYVRKVFQDGEMPEGWLIREEISEMINASIKNKEDVFYK